MQKMQPDTLYYFNRGELKDSYRHFGAHLIRDDAGHIVMTRFTVYAPHARGVRVLGDFNQYQNWTHQLTKIDHAGIYRIEIPENLEWSTYKYEIETADGRRIYKSDPYGYFSANRPDTVSKVYDIDGYAWQDDDFMAHRHETRPYDNPVQIYEVHLGTWMRKPNGDFHKYNELVDHLIPYLKANGYTHVELMPVIEHPFDGSWGYQGTGYYSATARFGVPKDLMYFIDQCHQNNIRVLLDWVPGHICKDAHGLYMFDGQPLYEYRDPFIRENIEWGTANLDLSRGETQSFLLSNALFWMRYFHVDGFRIDAVSNIIYFLGDARIGENHGAINFLRKLSHAVFAEYQEMLLIAEDSTAYPNVTHPVDFGGLGFNYKWNMGWMNDTLKYFEKDPIYRKYHHHELTFSLHYAFSENYVLPLSHDEVVHGKKTLVEKMPGDYWQKFANTRALMGYFYTHPGKTLLFMGQEFGQMHEWRDYTELDWHLLKYPMHDSLHRFNRDFKLLIQHEPALYELDHDSNGFQWIDAHNSAQSIISYIRYGKRRNDMVVVILNLTPIVHHGYEIGVPQSGVYEEILNSDAAIYGGSDQYNGDLLHTLPGERHRFGQHIKLLISPLSVTVLKWRGHHA